MRVKEVSAEGVSNQPLPIPSVGNLQEGSTNNWRNAAGRVAEKKGVGKYVRGSVSGMREDIHNMSGSQVRRTTARGI